MASFGERFRNALRGMADGVRRMIGAGERAETPPPAPPPAEDIVYETPPPEETGGGFIQMPVPEPPGTEEHEIDYVPRQGGRLGYWTVDQPNLYDVRNIMNVSGYSPDMIIVIHGVTSVAYPTKSGTVDIYLSYRFNRMDVQDALDDPNNESAEDWINDLVSEGYIPGQDSWDQVWDIKVVDWRGPTR